MLFQICPAIIGEELKQTSQPNAKGPDVHMKLMHRSFEKYDHLFCDKLHAELLPM